ncbi:peptidoglycan-binding protein [Kitasatospora sp. NPDC058190]|uniref:peptidoglycan-binding domain-containing protein n=1 Tax=Kitasatospora sp. NPDC058190 TaxID=3346371 RepID=UPI0036D847E3
MRFVRKILATGATLAAAGTMLVTAVPGAHAATGLSSLRQGSSGLGVACAQWEENRYFDSTQIAVDGDFGPATYNSTVNYQAQLGLQADGIIGPKTGDVIASGILQTLKLYPSANYQFWRGYWLSDCYGAVPTDW